VNLVELDLNENQIVTIQALSGLTRLESLGLTHNQIRSLRPLVINSGIDKGDDVALDYNLLNVQGDSLHMQDIAALKQRGVTVSHKEDCETCGY